MATRTMKSHPMQVPCPHHTSRLFFSSLTCAPRVFLLDITDPFYRKVFGRIPAQATEPDQLDAEDAEDTDSDLQRMRELKREWQAACRCTKEWAVDPLPNNLLPARSAEQPSLPQASTMFAATVPRPVVINKEDFKSSESKSGNV
jgi:hypothetical protein